MADSRAARHLDIEVCVKALAETLTEIDAVGVADLRVAPWPKAVGTAVGAAERQQVLTDDRYLRAEHLRPPLRGARAVGASSLPEERYSAREIERECDGA